MIKDKIKYIGRFDFEDPLGPKFAWSGSSIVARFYGKEVLVTLKSFGSNYFNVILDGKTIIQGLHVEGEGKFTLAKNLDEKEHKIELVKRTEFYIGTVQFLGFDFGDGKKLDAIKESNRRIEIIGDSITCAFGAEGDLSIEYEPKYDNAYLSYGAIAARKLNAQALILGRSGYGVLRDYEGNIGNTLQSLYSFITPENEGWNFACWIPQVVVINLGTNDFSFGHIPNRKEFTRAYINFVDKIYSKYPNTEVVCAIGPIIDGEVLEVTRDYIKGDIVSYFNKNNKKVYFLEFNHQKEEDGYGISYHPSLRTHELMGEQLTSKIKEIKDW
ncbi:MAG: SGNH/GDSL hydrolase family protein [Epulopiscium sp.]|nr:SGNH/GDSL hydrolase family protein [Candidatus Epulonipiscium sp.]